MHGLCCTTTALVHRAHSLRKPAALRRSPVSKVPAKRSTTRTSAALDMWTLADAAKDGYEYGSVAAPDGALIGFAVLIGIAGTASILLLQPGVDASIEMQKRDAKSFNKKDKR